LDKITIFDFDSLYVVDVANHVYCEKIRVPAKMQRVHASMVHYDGGILIYGGVLNGEYSNDVNRYCNGKFTKLVCMVMEGETGDGDNITKKRRQLHGRKGHCAVIVNDEV